MAAGGVVLAGMVGVLWVWKRRSAHLSGILRTQGPEIRARLGWHGLTLVAEERGEEWICVLARRDGILGET